jgi:hypothetical protein
MNTARYGQDATLLPDGRVLISGGTDGNGGLSSLETYDPAKGRFEDAGSTGTRLSPSVALLLDGRVLMVGGSPPSNVSFYVVRECEFFDVATHKLSPAASIGIEGNAFVLDVVSLIDGRVLVTEEANGSGQTAELFVP